MKSTLFILATLAVSGYAASLKQEAPKFLSQQEDAFGNGNFNQVEQAQKNIEELQSKSLAQEDDGEEVPEASTSAPSGLEAKLAEALANPKDPKEWALHI